MRAEPPAPSAERDAEAEQVLRHIQNSPAWKTIEAIKRTPPYQLLARARFGPDWQLVDPKEPAHVRLERLRASRTYRLVKGIDRMTGRARQ